MNLNSTPVANRTHIGIFGRRNAGKSSLINAITDQNIAIVSDTKGTTTDPVYKTMEILPLGPVVLIDTPGIDDEGNLGQLRITKAYQVLNKTDLALLVIDGTTGPAPEDLMLLQRIIDKQIPYLVIFNKADKVSLDNRVSKLSELHNNNNNIFWVSSVAKENLLELKELIALTLNKATQEKRLVGDLLSKEDLVILVVPLDSAAPKGRLILPQQQTIRDILESNATVIIVKEDSLTTTLAKLTTKPKLIITDSQVFAKVALQTPQDIFLTSFSILFARYKGDLATAIKGASFFEKLQDGDKILIGEGCTHHKQCDDIGTVKLPGWLQKYTNKNLLFEFTSGGEFPLDLSPYKMIIHCGGCMLNEREMQYRIKCAIEQNIPITNYGIAIAYMNNILKRTVQPFPEIYKLLQ